MAQEQQLAPIVVPRDGGQFYTETNFSRPIVEPWNAVSSLAILLPAVYWAFKIRKNYREYPFLALCLPLLFFGGLGSMIFHAFRNHKIWLLLDITPTAILTLLVALFFWMKVLPKKWLAIPLLVVVFMLRMLAWKVFPSHLGINISYLLSGTALFVPILLLLSRTNWRGVWPISLSIFFLISSLVFRQLDPHAPEFLFMGTHFLWHIFSGIGAYFLGLYFYQFKPKPPKPTSK